MNILFVDDKAALRHLYQKGLAQLGHRVVTAKNGGEAVRAVADQDFDLIFMDLDMPAVNGWQAISRIRTLGKGKEANIIVFTANEIPYSLQQVHRRGADGIATKPLSPRELLDHASQTCLY